ncbi:hypothetical protein A1OO_13535 [Enterovibrio norvegicus FF-33]|uniref:Uncharacterized protein n=1 Tax=Enterovibrio norvegicus FF-454 TaxID=1185651 RepID=A0A1E5CBJ1_9GAMM|nr:hypothetical protein [Enterovibrio norvegicus]OEE62859.1 hypothetical protein A1OK_19955 [Enterovibrio norvegicus FF-454]OEE66783.1 hypothetical protein A1OO_13535 [Enterovibrio norvegicus FF-33]
METWKEKEVAEFAVAVMSKRSVTGVGAEYEKSGSGNDWQGCIRLEFDGFSDARILNLDHIWKDMIENEKTMFSGEVLACETVSSSGESVLLNTPYEVEIRVSY